MNSTTSSPDTFPMAKRQKAKPRPWLWYMLPLIALALAAGVSWLHFAKGGILISVEFREGHGLEVGSQVRHRGVQVGRVEDIRLSPDTTSIHTTLRLFPGAENLAQGGSGFWVVRPQVSMTGIDGLETLIGARYVGVSPGDGAPKRSFLGLDRAPVLGPGGMGGLELVLETERKSGLHPGGPVLFRQVPVGRITDIGLAADASAVLVRIHIDQSYAHLVRDNSRFWSVAGLQIDLGLGIDVRLDSLASLVIGGIAFATPDEPAAPADSQQRFLLADKPESRWLQWRPSLLTRDNLPAEHLPLPTLTRTILSWDYSTWGISRQQQHQGWTLALDDGSALGPTNLLLPDSSASEGTSQLYLAGDSTPLPNQHRQSDENPAIVVVSWDKNTPTRANSIPWPRQRLRAPEKPEDILLIGDPLRAPLAISTARMQDSSASSAGWGIQRGWLSGDNLHGNVAMATADGAIIGIVVQDGRHYSIVPLTKGMITVRK